MTWSSFIAWLMASDFSEPRGINVHANALSRRLQGTNLQRHFEVAAP
jgi:hypothetical protein